MTRLRKERKEVRRITKARIDYLSLCPKGKNLMPTLYKEAGVERRLGCLLLKGTSEQHERGELLAVVYVPEKVDAEDEVASAAVVKAMAYSHAQGGFKLDLRHDEEPLEAEEAYVAESFLIQKGDPRFSDVKDDSGKLVDVTGAWGVVVKLESPVLKGLYRQGAWKGVSMGGVAARELDVVEKEDDVKPEEIEAISKAVATAVVTALAKSTEDKATVAKDDGTFKGDPSDLKAVRAHAAKLQKARLVEEVDWNDPEAVEAHLEALEKAEEERAAKRASGQPLKKGKAAQEDEGDDDEDFDVDETLKKGSERGSKLAEIANKQRGYSTAK